MGKLPLFTSGQLQVLFSIVFTFKALCWIYI
jgi:hypothetical protein